MPFVCFVFRWPPGIPISHLSDQPLCVPRRLAKVGEIEQSSIEKGVAAATRVDVLTSMRLVDGNTSMRLVDGNTSMR